MTAITESSGCVYRDLNIPCRNGQWLDIETAPKDKHILVMDRDKKRWLATWVSRWEEPGWCTIPGPFRVRPTHWMPIPEAPDVYL